MQERIERPYGGKLKRTFSRVIHITAPPVYHNKYDDYVMALMRDLHGKPNEASWAGVDCGTLKANLKLIYQSLRWSLLNAGEEKAKTMPATDERLEKLNAMFENPAAIIRIESQKQYFLTDRLNR